MGLSFDLSAIGGALLNLGMLLNDPVQHRYFASYIARIFKIDYHTMMITTTAAFSGRLYNSRCKPRKKMNNTSGILCGI